MNNSEASLKQELTTLRAQLEEQINANRDLRATLIKERKFLEGDRDEVKLQLNEAITDKEALRQQLAEREVVIDVASELLECAQLRGDNKLPHPADDEKLWTARMQDAWRGLEDALATEAEQQPRHPAEGGE